MLYMVTPDIDCCIRYDNAYYKLLYISIPVWDVMSNELFYRVIDIICCMVYRNMRKILYFMDTQAEGTIVPTGSIKRLTSGRIKRL